MFLRAAPQVFKGELNTPPHKFLGTVTDVNGDICAVEYTIDSVEKSMPSWTSRTTRFCLSRKAGRSATRKRAMYCCQKGVLGSPGAKMGTPLGKKWAHHWAKMGTPLEKNGHTIGQKWAPHWKKMGTPLGRNGQTIGQTWASSVATLGRKGGFHEGPPPGGVSDGQSRGLRPAGSRAGRGTGRAGPRAAV
eukprot:4670188-Prymnesium_polylepis.2